MLTRDLGKTVTGNPANEYPINGSVSISQNAVFFQLETGGILRTTDQGKTWKVIGGPSRTFDERGICAINNNIIVGIDDNGDFWRTDNCGGFPITAPSPIVVPPSALSMNECNHDSLKLQLGGSTCHKYHFTKVQFQGTDSSLFSTQKTLPMTLDDGARDSLTILIDSKQRSGVLNDSVKLTWYDEGEGIYHNMAFMLPVTINPLPPNLQSKDSSLDLDTATVCSWKDSIITLTNFSCDTIQIISGPGSLGGNFSVDPLGLPFRLPPDNIVIVHVHFHASLPGKYSASAQFMAEYRGLTEQITVPITCVGSGPELGLLYSPKQFNFRSLSICEHDSGSGFVTNIGCDSIILDPTTILGNPDFTYSALSTQPSALMPGDTIKYEVYVNPTQKGLRQGYLVLSSNNKISPRRDTLPFTVTVTDGTRILSTSLASADFGAVSVCDVRDTLVTLHNTGCDTVKVLGVGLQGSGFGSNATFPIMLLPGKDTTIDVFTLLDTAGGKTTTTGTLTIDAIADDTLPPITLSRTFVQATHLNVGMYLDATPKSGTDLTAVAYNIKESPGKTFTGTGIKNIAFDLNYNTDLLEFTPSKSTNVTSSDGKHFTISGSPEIQADASGVLANIGFTIYLTKDSTTTIDLANVKIDTVSLPCTITTFSYSGSAVFDYNFFCGERSLSGFMDGIMPMKIVSLRPNPAQDEIELDVQSAMKQDVRIEIFDALGAKVSSNMRCAALGSNTI
ncbi:MAG: hypothetical protein ACHQM6_08720, partial [Candidatus Kapaibacterium sp.]